MIFHEIVICPSEWTILKCLLFKCLLKGSQLNLFDSIDFWFELECILCYCGPFPLFELRFYSIMFIVFTNINIKDILLHSSRLINGKHTIYTCIVFCERYSWGKWIQYISDFELWKRHFSLSLWNDEPICCGVLKLRIGNIVRLQIVDHFACILCVLGNNWYFNGFVLR